MQVLTVVKIKEVLISDERALFAQFGAHWLETYKVLGVPESDRLDLSKQADCDTLDDIARAMFHKFRHYTKEQFFGAWVKTTMEINQKYPRWNPGLMAEEIFKRIQFGEPIPASRQLQSPEASKSERLRREFLSAWESPTKDFVKLTALNLAEAIKVFPTSISSPPDKFWPILFESLSDSERGQVAKKAEDEYRGKLLAMSIFSAETVDNIVSGEHEPDWHAIRNRHGKGYYPPYYLNIKRQNLLTFWIDKNG